MENHGRQRPERIWHPERERYCQYLQPDDKLVHFGYLRVIGLILKFITLCYNLPILNYIK